MNKILYLLLTFLLITNCSFNKSSKFWTSQSDLEEERTDNFKKILVEDQAVNKELNTNIKLNFNPNLTKNNLTYDLRNNTKFNYDGTLTKSSRYKFKKIKNFHKYEPNISFFKENVIFFDNKGTIFQFDDDSKLIWKKNYYSKNEKKQNPILQFTNDNKYLVIADNIAKLYIIDLITGELIWTKNNIAPFNSQIKIYNDKFFIIDLTNTLRCFSLKDGKELWTLKTEDTLIKSQKKLSMVILDEKIYFNNSIGDISAVNLNTGDLLWQLSTQSSLIYESAFSLETSEIVSDGENLFFSNNKNQFFSIDIKSGSFNWENKINSNIRPKLIGDIILSISLEGYLILIDKKNGNIIRTTDIFKNFKPKKRDKIKPSGFVMGLDKIYLSTNNGRLLVIDISSGKTIKTLKIDNEKISRPYVSKQNLFIIKDNAIIRLN